MSTRQNLEKPLSLSEAIQVTNDYLETGIKVINQRETQIRTFLDLLSSVTTRKKVFDIALVVTLKDNGIYKNFRLASHADRGYLDEI